MDEDDKVNRGSRPIPDPTTLTTQALTREIAAVRELLEEKITTQANVTAEKFISVDERFAANKEAISKVETATEKRFDEIEKSRKNQYDLINQALPRAEYAASKQALIDKIDSLTTRFERNEGTGLGLKQGWGWLVAAIGALAAIIAIFSR